MESEIKEMIEGGYWSEKDLQPLKCIKCDSAKLKMVPKDGFDFFTTEYESVCDSCGHVNGHWSYGNWIL